MSRGQAGPGFSLNPAPPGEFGAAHVDVAWLDGGSITATGNSFAARVLGAHPDLTPFHTAGALAVRAAEATGGPR